MAPGLAQQPSRWLVLVVIAICVVVSLVAGLAWRPAPSRLPSTQSGDSELAELGRRIVGDDRPALAVACITRTQIRTAAMGAQPTDRFEIGSVSKGLTGLLFADMIKRGEVRTDTRLGELLPVSGELAEVRLSQLATHTSGLPAQLPTLRQYGRNYWATLTAGNPYDGSVQQRLDAVADVPLDAPSGTYSNLAFELLGAALAAAADHPYRDLLRERILEPVGLTEASVPYVASELTDRDLLGETGGGRTNDAWFGEAMAPAGGVRADIDQMALFTQRLLTGQAPGMDALEPEVTDQDESTGWAWVTMPSPSDGRTITWHNGGTGGFTSFLGLDRERQVGVVILSARGEIRESRHARRIPAPARCRELRMIIAAVFWFLTLVVVALFVCRAWSAEVRLPTRSRTSASAHELLHRLRDRDRLRGSGSSRPATGISCCAPGSMSSSCWPWCEPFSHHRSGLPGSGSRPLSASARVSPGCCRPGDAVPLVVEPGPPWRTQPSAPRWSGCSPDPRPTSSPSMLAQNCPRITDVDR